MSVLSWTVLKSCTGAVLEASLTLGDSDGKPDFERCGFGTLIPLSVSQG